MLTGSVLGVFIRQQITLLINLCHKEPLVIEPPIRFNVTHAIINPASADIIVQCALEGDPRNMRQTTKSLALGPGHATDPFGKAITGVLVRWMITGSPFKTACLCVFQIFLMALSDL
jgi:hypothetical protein